METLPSAEDIRGAALQIEEEAAKTPVLESALLNERIDAKGKTVGIVLSGGNVDGDVFTKALNQPESD